MSKILLFIAPLIISFNIQANAVEDFISGFQKGASMGKHPHNIVLHESNYVELNSGEYYISRFEVSGGSVRLNVEKENRSYAEVYILRDKDFNNLIKLDSKLIKSNTLEDVKISNLYKSQFLSFDTGWKNIESGKYVLLIENTNIGKFNSSNKKINEASLIFKLYTNPYGFYLME